MKTSRQRLSLTLLTTYVLAIFISLGAVPGAAETSVVGTNLQKLANGVLGLMGYSLTPDVTTGSLSFANAESGDPGFQMSSLGGGFTISKGFPLYLEGTVAYSRYDPTFVVSDGKDERSIPVKWNSLSGTVGIGWDFPVAKELILRPMVNFSLGRVSSDHTIGKTLVEIKTGKVFEFLNNGHLDALGLGGSLVLE
mgnify:FL=1